MGDLRFAIVGGGIVGASVAYHLSEQTDEQIVVYDRGGLASETTFKSTAMIGVSGPDPYYRMKEYGFRMYNEFFVDPVANPRYRQAGRLRVATSTSGAEMLSTIASANAVSSDDNGPAENNSSTFSNSRNDYVQGNEIQRRFLLPALDTDIIEGALFRPHYGYILDESHTLGARELAFEFINRARENGVMFRTDTEVTDIFTDGDRVVGLETNGSDVIATDIVICAAGPWSASVTALAGLDLPIEHVPSPVLSLQLDEPLSYTLPAIKSHESSVGLHLKRDDTVLVTYTPLKEQSPSYADPTAVGDTVPNEFRGTALNWAERLLPMLEEATVKDEWVGMGTTTPDGNPIAGWTRIDGLSLAVTMSGIQYAPAIGSIVARQLIRGEPTEYYNAVSISRFEGYSDFSADEPSS